MAFVVPTMPTHFAYWEGGNLQSHWAQGAGFVPDPDWQADGQLRGLTRPVAVFSINEFSASYDLLIPFDTDDVYFPPLNTNEWWYVVPMVEVPVGSGMFYFVFGVSDVATGFSNRYRILHVGPTYPFEGNWGWSGYPHWPWCPSWPQPFPHTP